MAGPCCSFRDRATTVRSTTYVTMVRPYTVSEYAAIVWNPYNQKDAQVLEKVERRAARYACNNFRDS